MNTCASAAHVAGIVVASSKGDAAAVFVREEATGRILGATVSKTLAVKPLKLAIDAGTYTNDFARRAKERFKA